MQQQDLLAAESAVALLRASVKEQSNCYGDLAKKQAAQLRDRVRIAHAAVEAIRPWVSYHSGARQVSTDVDRLVQEAEQRAAQLDAHGQYRGRLRSQMSTQEKAEYVREHGHDGYMKLPW